MDIKRWNSNIKHMKLYMQTLLHDLRRRDFSKK